MNFSQNLRKRSGSGLRRSLYDPLFFCLCLRRRTEHCRKCQKAFTIIRIVSHNEENKVKGRFELLVLRKTCLNLLHFKIVMLRLDFRWHSLQCFLFFFKTHYWRVKFSIKPGQWVKGNTIWMAILSQFQNITANTKQKQGFSSVKTRL